MALYACPKCRAEDSLVVQVICSELLLQTEGDEFETEIIDGCHWWDENSDMTCRKCAWVGTTDDAFKENQNGSSS